MRSSSSIFLVASALAMASAPPARAALPTEGWPQSRRDAALSGRSNEPALPSARLRWLVLTGAELSGEPVVNGCSVAVTSGDGRVHAFNARDGAPLFSHARAYAVPPIGVASSLAIDGDTLFVGLPADPLLVRSMLAISTLRGALESYAIDNNTYPPGPDLAAALTPTYIRSLPQNPITGSVMVGSDTPSPGDYRYECAAPSGEYFIGVWGSDGGLLDLGDACGGRAGGLAAAWPVSAEHGGTPTALDLATGALRWQSLAEGITATLVPSVTPAGVDWASQEQEGFISYGWWYWWGGWGAPLDTTTAGVVRRTRADGSGVWTDHGWGGARGGAGHDASGNSFVSRGSAEVAQVAMGTLRALATAVEAYSIDNNAYPPSGDLEPNVVPVYIPCMPGSLLHPGEMRSGSWASGGDYEYVSPDPFSYTITRWDEDGGIHAVFDTGAFTVVAEDLPSDVASLAPDGSLRWRIRVGLRSQDVTPVLLTPDGAVVVGTTGGDLIALDASSGAERWRQDVGEPLALAPALMPDGGVVVVTGNGSVVAHAPDGSERWRQWIGATVTAAPSTSADGVTYVADLDGTLSALAPADGAFLWRTYLGGTNRAGLTTTPVQSAGWIYVGRSDGALLAVVPRETAGRPAAPAPLLATGEKSATTVGWSWATVPLPSDPGAHWHFRRWRGSLDAIPDELLTLHPSLDPGFLDAAADGSLVFYSLAAADCAENESFGP